ncbi:MAG: hypothetical protein AAFX95_26480 [Cyanobacteria bacterium J06639_16]
MVNKIERAAQAKADRPQETAGHQKVKACSFTISAKKAPTAAAARASHPPERLTVDPFPVHQFPGTLPMLPRLKRTALSSHRHEANPALAMTMLRDIQQMVETWQQDLRTILVDIQNIYLEGPIVDGWLESYQPQAKPPAELDAAVLRHGDTEQLMTYVNHLCEAQTQGEPSTASTASSQLPGLAQGLALEPNYRLCGLDEEGKLRCQPCPPEQMPAVSMAIARNQRLRQLLNQKQYLEARLKRAVDALSGVRRELQIESSPLTAPED